jgi:hypothetical protein
MFNYATWEKSNTLKGIVINIINKHRIIETQRKKNLIQYTS